MHILKSVRPSPEQLMILTDVAPGFRVIRGAAGSGKTSAALLRLRQLCRSRRNRRARQGEQEPIRVLVLTFNRTLRGYISQLASEQVQSSDDLVLTVDTFGRWAMKLVEEQDLLEDDGHALIRKLLVKADLPGFDLDYLVDEIKYIQGRFQPEQREKYLDAIRSGRGRVPAVPKNIRRKLLNDVLYPYELMKSRKQVSDWNDLALKTAEVPRQNYDVVIVDESEDLSANQFRAIIGHLADNHVTTFIIDTVQRTYPQSFNWNELGITMRPHMVFTLSGNYRNTAEIARLTSSLVRDLPADDDGVLPDEGACRESGIRPVVVEGSYSAQIEYMLNRVKPYLAAGQSIGILHPRGGGWFGHTRWALERKNVNYCELTRNREWPTGPELVALSTIHSAKGLEFDHVLMPGLNSELTPHGEEDGDGTLDSLCRLIAMGIGRARKTVMLGYKPGKKSTVFHLIRPGDYDLIKI